MNIMSARPRRALEDAPASSPRIRDKGLRPGTIESRSDEAYCVRTLDGEQVVAVLGPRCSAALAEECLRDARVVLLYAESSRLVILGALQTEPSAFARHDGVVTLRADELHLEASQRVRLQAGPSRLDLLANGKLQLWGERLTMHVAKVIKLIASKVELP
jgi:hypothetical protein